MAGIVHQGPHLPAWGPDNPPPPIPGLTEEGMQAYYNPPPPHGYTWASYVKAVQDAMAQGEPGPRPFDERGFDMIGDNDTSPQTWLQYNMGYGRLAPLIAADEAGQTDPDTQQFLSSTYYANTAKDTFSPFGDQFFTALLGLGLATGGAAAAGAFTPAAPAAATVPAVAEAAAPGALGGTIGGYGTAASVPELLAGGTGGLAGSTVPALAAGTTGAGGGLLSALGIGLPTTPLGWASLVGSGISGLGSLVGGIQGAGAAKDAAATQVQSAQNANKLLADIYTQQRSDLAPYSAVGTASLGELMRQRQTNQQAPMPGFNLANYRR